MNPHAYPAGPSVPLVNQSEMAPGRLQGATVGHYTTVNVTRELPRDHIIWSLFSFMYMNPFCLGLAALIHSVKARDRKLVGDLEGARQYGSTARNLNIAAVVLVSTLTLILIIVFSVTASQAANYHYSYGGRYRY